jgi:uncharacterized protein (DUF433 family)
MTQDFLRGHADANHRIKDAIRDRAKAGEDIADIAGDYDVSVAAIRAVLRETVVDLEEVMYGPGA